MNKRAVLVLQALVAFAMVRGASWIVAKAADRIFINPRPEAHLIQLFPAAVAFSPLAGEPLHLRRMPPIRGSI